jgi:hypothetical protein
MFGWSFAAREGDAFARLVAGMGKHRYLAEADLRLHFLVDRALSAEHERFAAAAARFDAFETSSSDCDPRSRDPRLWRSTAPDEIAQVLALLWGSDAQGERARAALVTAARIVDVAPPPHAPFAGDIDEPSHPELILLDWTFLPVDQLDVERHRGALRAMEDSGDEVDPSEPIYVEGPTLGEAELCSGPSEDLLVADPIFWADGPYSYVEYVFRGVGKAAKLPEAPEGYRDVDKALTPD